MLLTYSFSDGHESQVVTLRPANNAGEQNQLLEEVQRWLSPPDPTVNYNVAREARLEGTARWFLQGNTFKSWKSTGSLLWIHGKRVLFYTFTL